PQDMWTVGSLVVPLGVLGMIVLRRQSPVKALALMWSVSLGLLMYSTLTHVISQAMPTRLVVIHVVLLAPFAAALLERVAKQGVLLALAVSALLVGLGLQHWSELPNYPPALAPDVEQIGRVVNQWRAEGIVQRERTIMLEVRFWEYPIQHVLSGDPAAVVYDRPPILVVTPSGEQTLDDATNPSVLAQPATEVQEALAHQRVQVVIAHSERAVNNLRLIAREALVTGRWHVFILD
ncbi:MAG: hypothetical protein LC737_02900, partial [Chloroflexi bacterium]|nr:hypothetical protein [Chloroflexota bacterium]